MHASAATGERGSLDCIQTTKKETKEIPKAMRTRAGRQASTFLDDLEHGAELVSVDLADDAQDSPASEDDLDGHHL